MLPMNRIIAVVLVASVLPTVLGAQQVRPGFKAFVAPEGIAFAEPSLGGEPSMNMPGRTAGMIGMRNVALRDIIGYAYGVAVSPLGNAPDGISNERFDVGAKVSADAAPERIRMLLQRLLENRFKLRVHQEVQQAPNGAIDVLVIDQVERPSEN
jgi:hypothetical protein